MPQLVIATVQHTVDQFTITGTTPSSATTAAVGSVVTGLGRFASLFIVGSLIGATGGTLDLTLQVSPDLGTTFVDYIHFPQLAAGAGAIVKAVSVARAGQSNSIATASAAGAVPAIVTVGTGAGALAVLTAGVAIGGDFTDRMRLVATGGAGTSAGASITIFISAAT